MKTVCIDFEFRETDKREYELLCVSLYAPNVIDKQIWLDAKGRAELVQLMHDFKDYAFIAHYCHAEIYSLLSLNDTSINTLLDEIRFIDTFIEAKLLTNTDDKERTPKLGLANLVKKYKIYDYGELKDTTRNLILGQTEYNEDEKQQILAYCRIDTVVNYDLYVRLVDEHLKIFGIPVKLSNQIIRSEYVKSQCLASYTGMPVDLEKLGILRKNYYHIVAYFFSRLSDDVKGLYEYKGLLPTFKYDKFANKVKEWEALTHAKWDLTEKGRYSAEGKYLKSISNSAEWVGELASYQKKIRSLSSIKYDPAKMATERLQQSEIRYTLESIPELQEKYKNIKAELACKSKTSLEALAKSGNKQALEAIIVTEICTLIRAKAKSSGDEEGVKKESLYEAIKTDGRVHQGYNVMKNLSFRNAPRSSSFIPAMSSWLRGLHYVPKGYKMVIIDIVSAEIILGALISGDQDLLDASQYDFYQYSAYKMGLSTRADVEVSKDEYEKRHGKLRTQVKVCFTADTLVITDNGKKRIIEVEARDKVWNGERWCTHEGVLYQGEREILEINGIEATSDHLFYYSNGGNDEFSNYDFGKEAEDREVIQWIEKKLNS